jgi:26S proteasome regulatory subunit T3
MADVLVEHSANAVLPHKKSAPADSIPNIDSLEGSGNDGGDEYSTLKRFQRHLEYEFMHIQTIYWPD